MAHTTGGSGQGWPQEAESRNIGSLGVAAAAVEPGVLLR
jgi:hypothetical protein